MSNQIKTITVVLNGERRQVPEGLSVATFLEHMGLPGDRVAVELNRRIIRKIDWQTSPISNGARVGGGALRGRRATLMRWLGLTTALALTLVLVALVYTTPTVQAEPEYADSRACATCHRQIAEDYARTGMGRSFSKPTAGADQGEYEHALSGTHFAMTSRDGETYQRRWQIGAGGQAINVEEMRVDYVMGSGNHARSFLHRTPRGTLIELPLGWYAEGGGHWAMSPGSDTPRPRTRRFISYRCMSCHNGVPQIPAANEAPGSDPVYVGELPMGIDCQRCHGPGAEHIRAAGNRQRTIVNPARLSTGRRMEVCLQCHLETTSGRIPSAIVRFNRGPFSFVPGEALSNFLIAFDHAPGTGHDAKFEVVGSAYRLRQSRCFRESADE